MLCPRVDEHRVVQGMPPEALFPAKFMKGGRPKRLLYADLTGTRRDTNRYYRVRDRAISALERHGVHLKRMANNTAPALLGGGRYAEVYSVRDDDQWVIKITGDVTEAVAWARVAQTTREGEVDGRDLPTLAEVKCVYLVPANRREDRDLYVIVMRRYKGLSRPDKSLIEKIDKEVLLGDKDGPCLQAPYLALSRAAKLAKQRTAVSQAEKQAMAFIETLQNLAKIGVFIYDIHGDNAMRDGDGQWKLTDIGVSEVAYPVSIPVLR
jgi:hypothetical protein